MPTGSPIRRKLENGFSPEKRDKYDLMFYWMDFLNKNGADILHYRNQGMHSL